MMSGKAARTIGLLLTKLPVSSNNRNTSTRFVSAPVLGNVMLTVWRMDLARRERLVMLAGLTLPTAGLLTPLGQRIPPTVVGYVRSYPGVTTSRTT